MGQHITSPDKFAAWFNEKVPGAPRRITAGDVRLMTKCGLIGRYDFYGSTDLQIVRGILKYEQLRDRTPDTQAGEAAIKPRLCKLCSQPLPPEQDDKKGRPKEYCPQCKSFRLRERHRRWLARKHHKQKRLTETEAVYN